MACGWKGRTVVIDNALRLGVSCSVLFAEGRGMEKEWASFRQEREDQTRFPGWDPSRSGREPAAQERRNCEFKAEAWSPGPQRSEDTGLDAGSGASWQTNHSGRSFRRLQIDNQSGMAISSKEHLWRTPSSAAPIRRTTQMACGWKGKTVVIA